MQVFFKIKSTQKLKKIFNFEYKHINYLFIQYENNEYVFNSLKNFCDYEYNGNLENIKIEQLSWDKFHKEAMHIKYYIEDLK